MTRIIPLFLASCCLMAADPAPAPAKAYPLDTCIVSGEKLGSMGDAVVVVHEGQEVKFCCRGCIKAFNKDPAKYIKDMTEKAAAKAATAAPAK